MPVLHRKPLAGALLLASFITCCLAWLFHGSGAPVPWWGYPIVFALFALWLDSVGNMLMSSTLPHNHVRSFDVSIEGT